MLSESEIARARVTPPPERLDSATIRLLIAARPESDLAARVASAMYLDTLAAEKAAGLPSSVRARRVVAFVEEKLAILSELAADDHTRAYWSALGGERLALPDMPSDLTELLGTIADAKPGEPRAHAALGLLRTRWAHLVPQSPTGPIVELPGGDVAS